MKNPDSFKIESIEIRKDTIPTYLTSDMLKLADKVIDAADDMERYSNMSYLFADEKYRAATVLLKANERSSMNLLNPMRNL